MTHDKNDEEPLPVVIEGETDVPLDDDDCQAAEDYARLLDDMAALKDDDTDIDHMTVADFKELFR